MPEPVKEPATSNEPSLKNILGAGLARKVERNGPWDREDLPVLGRALTTVEGRIMSDLMAGGTGVRAEMHRDYVTMQRAYYEVLRQQVGERTDPEARTRLDRYRAARVKLLESMRDRSEADRKEAQKRLKREMLRRPET